MSTGWALTSFPCLAGVRSFSPGDGNNPGFSGLTKGLDDTKHGTGPPSMRAEGARAQMCGFALSVAFTHTREKEKVCLWGPRGDSRERLGTTLVHSSERVRGSTGSGEGAGGGRWLINEDIFHVGRW